MSLPESTQVLIIGGGPVGLACAVSLYKEGFQDVVVVDAIHKGDNSSRALVMHAATVEALETLGLAEKVLSQGRKLQAASVWVGGSGYFVPTRFSALGAYTKYPFALCVPQFVTEKILGDRAEELGVRIVRPLKMVSLRPNEEDSKFTDVIFEDGRVVRARVVVGADGARSEVRRIANIGWADPDGVAIDATGGAFRQMIIADVTFSAPPATLPQDNIVTFAHGDNTSIIIPLPSPYLGRTERVYRIIFGIPDKLGVPPPAPDTVYVQSLLDAWGPPGPRTVVSDTLWSSRFRTHSAIAASPYARIPGPVLLIGDAAHIHSPAGGQGLNLGIRDGVSLAPVLASYLAGKTSEDALEAWAADRHAKAQVVIRFAKKVLNLLSVPDRWVWYFGIIPVNFARLRNIVMRIQSCFLWATRRNAYGASGLGNR